MRSYYISIQQRVDGEDTSECRDAEIEFDLSGDFANDMSTGLADVEQMIEDMEQEIRLCEVIDENMGKLGRLAGHLLGGGILNQIHDGQPLVEGDIEYDPQAGEAEFVLHTPEGDVRFTLKLEEPAEVEV